MFKIIFKILGLVAITVLIVFGTRIYINFDLIKERTIGIVSNKPSMVGDYLSARYAFRNNQIEDAYKYSISALRKDPENEELLKTVYLLMISMGKVDDAKNFVDRHYLSETSDEMTIAMKSIFAFKSKDYVSAHKYAVEGIKNIGKYKNNEIVTILLPSLEAMALAGQGKFDESLSIFDKLDDLRLEQYVAFQKARIYSIMGDFKKAGEMFDKVVDESKTFNNMITAASFYSDLGKNDKVINIIKKYNSIEPPVRITKEMIESNSNFYNSIDSAISGILLEQAAFVSVAGRINDSITYLHLSSYISSESDYITLLIAKLLEGKEMYSDAIDIYKFIKDTSSYYNNALMNKALVLSKVDKIEEAEKILKKVALNEAYFKDAYSRLGDILIADKQYKKASGAYSEIIKKTERDKFKSIWTVYYARGICFERMGRWEDAENDFITALTYSPKEPSVLNYLAYSWLMKGTNLEEAKRMLKIALRQRPGDAHIIDSYGWALYKNGDSKGAMDFIEKANLMLPHDSVTNDHLGDIYWSMNRKTEAVYQWERALDLNPEPEDKERITTKLNNVFKKKVSFIDGKMQNYK